MNDSRYRGNDHGGNDHSSDACDGRGIHVRSDEDEDRGNYHGSRNLQAPALTDCIQPVQR